MNELDMAQFIPRPEWMEKYRDGISSDDENYEKYNEWFQENYGGPGRLFDRYIKSMNITFSLSDDAKPSAIEYSYETKWSPNIRFIVNVSKMYPSLTFDYGFHEDMGQFKGRVICTGGKRILEDTYTELWATREDATPQHELEIFDPVAYEAFRESATCIRGTIRNISPKDLPPADHIDWDLATEKQAPFKAYLSTNPRAYEQSGHRLINPQLESICFLAEAGGPVEIGFPVELDAEREDCVEVPIPAMATATIVDGDTEFENDYSEFDCEVPF
jgi:hypothetical protein